MNFFTKVYLATKKIPKGKVASYGQIVALCGNPRAARQVGWALHALDTYNDQGKVPWQRVLNRNGMISTSCLDHLPEEQAHLLRNEGIRVDEKKRKLLC